MCHGDQMADSSRSLDRRLVRMTVQYQQVSKWSTLFTDVEQSDIADKLASMCWSDFVGEFIDWRRPQSLLCHLLQLTNRISPVILFRLHREMTRSSVNIPQNSRYIPVYSWLQHAHDSIACVVLPCHTHLPPSLLLHHLYWLPADRCIQYEHASLTYNTLSVGQPLHIYKCSFTWLSTVMYFPFSHSPNAFTTTNHIWVTSGITCLSIHKLSFNMLTQRISQNLPLQFYSHLATCQLQLRYFWPCVCYTLN